jgi:hypothetical protein
MQETKYELKDWQSSPPPVIVVGIQPPITNMESSLNYVSNRFFLGYPVTGPSSQEVESWRFVQKINGTK